MKNVRKFHNLRYVTPLEVLDDAVKIGLGSLFGWLIARSSRQTEFEKERRRRKQDCLERVIEDFDESEASIQALFTSGPWAKGTERSIKYGAQAAEEAARDYEKNEVAATKLLYRSKSKLIVFGFTECASALEEYYAGILNFRSTLAALRADFAKLDEFFDSREKLLRLGNAFRNEVTKAFKAL